MAQLSNQEFYDKWVPLLADNVFQDINGARFEQLLEDIRDSFANLAGQAAQPVPPAVNFDPATRQLTAQHPLGAGELEYAHHNGGFSAYAPIQVDDLVHAQGEWRFRVKGATGRNPSQLTDSPPIGAKQTTGAAGPFSILASQISDSSAVGRNILRATTYGKQLQLLDNLGLDDYPQFARAYTKDGAIQYLLDAVAALQAAASPGAPAAPTAGQVDDKADTFSFLPNPDYPSFSQYLVSGLPGVTGAVVLDATNSYVQSSRVYVEVVGAVAKGGLAVYVAGSGNRPDGHVLPNADPFTGTTVVTPPTTAALKADFIISSSTATAGQNLSYSATASGGTTPYQHVVQVTNADTGQVTTIGSASTASYSGVWQVLPQGTYDLTDTVTDAAGTSKVSASRRVTVQAATGSGGTITPGTTTPTPDILVFTTTAY